MKTDFKTFVSFALFEVLLIAISLRTGLRTELEFVLNCLFLILITIGLIAYANNGILTNELDYSLFRTSLFATIGLIVGLMISYFLWFYSQSAIVREADWYPGLIVYFFRLGFGVLSIFLSVGIIATIRVKELKNR